MPIAAAYFDGKSSQHTKGTLEVADGHLVFTSEQGLPAYIDIARLKPPSPAADGKVMLEGLPDAENPVAARFLVLDSAFRKQLRGSIQKVRPGYGGGSPVKTIILAVVALGAAAAFWKLGLQK